MARLAGVVEKTLSDAHEVLCSGRLAFASLDNYSGGTTVPQAFKLYDAVFEENNNDTSNDKPSLYVN